MVAALLYHHKFTGSLKRNGYKMNPYDPCIWNKVSSQCTICFHLDDCKISHKSQKVIDTAVEWLPKDYKSIFEDGNRKKTMHQGKVHKYLGMILDITT
jgi:hypothetical protein